VPFIAGGKPPEVLQQREEAFDLPATAVPAELAPVLGDGAERRAVRSDELDATFGKVGIQRVAIVAAVAYDPCRQLAEEACRRAASVYCDLHLKQQRREEDQHRLRVR